MTDLSGLPDQPAPAAFEGSVEPPARRLGGVKAVGILGILAGALLIVGGVVVVIIVSADAAPDAALLSAWVVPYGLAALSLVTGILSILFGWAIHRLASAPVVLRPSRVAEL